MNHEGNPAQDYDALRHGAAGREVPRDVLVVHGPDAESYLQGQCTQDVAALAVGHSAETLLLNPQGKIDAYLRVTRRAADAFVLDTEGGFGPAMRSRLERFKLRVKVTVDGLDWRCVSVRGPDAPGAGELAVDGGLALDYRWGAVGGVDLLGESVALPSGTVSCGAEAFEAWRVETGIPAMGAELDERTIPVEAGLLERCVSFTKGCYTGQELVARLEARGNRVARHLRGLVVVGASPDAAVGAAGLAGSELVDGDGKTVGSVTSGASSPELGLVALGYVHRAVAAPATVSIRLSGGGELTAEVRALPLVN